MAALTEEEQVQAMLEAMGASSIEDIVSPALLATTPDTPEAEAAPPAATSVTPSPEAGIPQMPPAARMRGAGAPARDLPISTLMHVLGLPSARQLEMVEAKVDSLTRKLSALSTKIDQLSKALEGEGSEGTIERIDYQLSNIRVMLRALNPNAAAVPEPQVKAKAAKIITSQPQSTILSSSGEAAVSAADEPEAPLSDAEYQQQEAMRIRVKTSS